jgi:hypothetical protein
MDNLWQYLITSEGCRDQIFPTGDAIYYWKANGDYLLLMSDVIE